MLSKRARSRSTRSTTASSTSSTPRRPPTPLRYRRVGGRQYVAFVYPTAAEQHATALSRTTARSYRMDAIARAAHGFDLPTWRPTSSSTPACSTPCSTPRPRHQDATVDARQLARPGGADACQQPGPTVAFAESGPFNGVIFVESDEASFWLLVRAGPERQARVSAPTALRRPLRPSRCEREQWHDPYGTSRRPGG